MKGEREVEKKKVRTESGPGADLGKARRGVR